MSLPQAPGAYGLGPSEGEALWFSGSLTLLKATAESTDGRFAALEVVGPVGFAAPPTRPPERRRVLLRDIRRGQGSPRR